MACESIQTHKGHSGSSLRAWIAEIRQWLRHARIAANLPHQDMSELSDRHLHDLSVRQTDIGRLVDRDKNWILQASLTRAHKRITD